jgi:hypothetical protein
VRKPIRRSNRTQVLRSWAAVVVGCATKQDAGLIIVTCVVLALAVVFVIGQFELNICIGSVDIVLDAAGFAIVAALMVPPEVSLSRSAVEGMASCA